MQSSGSCDEELFLDEGGGYFFDDDEDNQNAPLVIHSTFPTTDLALPTRMETNSKHGSSCSFKACFGVALVMMGGILTAKYYKHSNYHNPSIGSKNSSGTNNNNAEATGSSWRPDDSADNQVKATIPSCGEEFLDGRTWESWMQLQGSLPAQGKCRNPLTPWDKTAAEMKLWKPTFERNKELVRQSISHDSRPLDVVLFGDSITEHWLGTDLGKAKGNYQDIVPVYEAFFRSESAPLHGLALGIGGDRCPNLLYRIMQGEMPDELQSKIFWILIGTNDFGGDKCSVDAITAGNIGIAQHILKAKTNARVVLNSILPRGRKDLTKDSFEVLRAINQRLECFANTHDRVHFFNATDSFTTADGQFLNMTLMVDDVHPGPIGSEIWAQGITDFALDLIHNTMDEADVVPRVPASVSVTEPAAAPSGHVCDESGNHYQGITWEEWVEAQGLEARRCVATGPAQNKMDPGGCRCADPTQAQSNPYPDWRNSHARNVALVEEEITQSNIRPLDVVLFGDSIIEFWQGVFRGKPLKQLQQNVHVYNDLFRSNSSTVRGLGLGTSGDQSVNLLYRLENGELPQELDSPIFWILIGTNDWGVAHCNEDMITASVLKVVDALRSAKPDSQIVINSVFPRGQDPLHLSDSWKVFRLVNERLECYATAHKGVSYFNAMDIFLTGQGDGIRVDRNMMTDYLHPNARGYKAWGDQIVSTVLEML
eukprot:scaffold10570_cov176-Amphora_coffeaeformis.AAC.31